ncbi:MAG TPA: hypothetical protein VFY54_12030 [Rubrobacter sp.]|nr:hypothetical protein [Rubrobacter sp.]
MIAATIATMATVEAAKTTSILLPRKTVGKTLGGERNCQRPQERLPEPREDPRFTPPGSLQKSPTIGSVRSTRLRSPLSPWLALPECELV